MAGPKTATITGFSESFSTDTMAVSFTPINNCDQQQPFAECKGVDLSRKLDQSSIENIRLGLLEHGLLLFRNQKEEGVQLGARAGPKGAPPTNTLDSFSKFTSHRQP